MLSPTTSLKLSLLFNLPSIPLKVFLFRVVVEKLVHLALVSVHPHPTHRLPLTCPLDLGGSFLKSPNLRMRSSSFSKGHENPYHQSWKITWIPLFRRYGRV